MIVTTGHIIKVETGKFQFERTSEAPGVVYLKVLDSRPMIVELPTNNHERAQFIAAYERAATADIEYRKRENE